MELEQPLFMSNNFHEGLDAGLKLGQGKIAFIHVVPVKDDRGNPEFLLKGPLNIDLPQGNGHTGFVPVQNSPIQGVIPAGLDNHGLSFPDGDTGNQGIGLKAFSGQGFDRVRII
jgi:hypothetical protein